MKVAMRIKKPLSVTIGPMFSSKSTALVHRADRCFYQHSCPVVFKPRVDNRDGEVIKTHEGAYRPGVKTEAFYIYNPSEMLEILAEVMDSKETPHRRWSVFIDEFQFFDETFLINAISKIGDVHSVDAVHLYGLNLDARGYTWDTIVAILPYATEINLLTAVCQSCQGTATRTQRLTAWPSPGAVAIGSGQDYAPACLKCWSAEPVSLKTVP